MSRRQGILPQIAAGDQLVRHCGQLRLQAGGEDGQPHHLDEADVLLFDVVELRVGVVETQRVLRRGQVVAQHQVQLIVLPPPAGDGGDGVVGLAVGLSQNHGALVGIAPPGGEDTVGQVHQPVRLGRGEADDRHGPLDDARPDVLIPREGDGSLHRGLLHGEGVPPALEVVVGQDGAAHDGQVRVGAHEVVGELPHKVQQLGKAGPVDLHGDVLPVQADAVLVVVHIGGVL